MVPPTVCLTMFGGYSRSRMLGGRPCQSHKCPPRSTTCAASRARPNSSAGGSSNSCPQDSDPVRSAAGSSVALDDHATATGVGVALPDNVGFAVPELSSGRQSFSPDAAYFVGPPPADDMDFVAGPPTLAVEVRSKGDYGDAAEAEMEAKRADYFEAGTAVVWDVDPRERRHGLPGDGSRPADDVRCQRGGRRRAGCAWLEVGSRRPVRVSADPAPREIRQRFRHIVP